MKHPWLTLRVTIALTAVVTAIYLLSIALDARFGVVLGLLLLSMLATIWMVFRILKDPYTTDKTFDEYFYQDRDDIRPQGPD